MKTSLSSFAHDSVNLLCALNNTLSMVERKDPELRKLGERMQKIVSGVVKTHDVFFGLMKWSDVPKRAELQHYLSSYRHELGKWDRQVPSMAKALKSFMKRRSSVLNKGWRTTLTAQIKLLDRYLKEFPASRIGTKIAVSRPSKKIRFLLNQFPVRNIVGGGYNPLAVAFRSGVWVSLNSSGNCSPAILQIS